MKVLNLYAGIGGNRKLWPDNEIEVTAVEINPDIAKIYQDFFPDDKMIVGDAHQYLLEHYKEFDFIWSSPPCQSHSKFRYLNDKKIYPNLSLYQEIILLGAFAKNKWVVENVIPYYKPLIAGTEAGRHMFWSNFVIRGFNRTPGNPNKNYTYKDYERLYNINLSGYNLKGFDRRKILRNCVVPELGLHIFNSMDNQGLTLDLKGIA